MDDHIEMDWMTEEGVELDSDEGEFELEEWVPEDAIEEFPSSPLAFLPSAITDVWHDRKKRRIALMIAAVVLAVVLIVVAVVGLLVIGSFLSRGDDDKTVSTSCGDIIGNVSSENSEVISFLGLRYAEPPTGNLRWQPAVPIASQCWWNGTLYATSSGPACMQFPLIPLNVDQAEDCLRLNILRPKGISSSDSVPVVFWIHGGGNIMGYNYFYPNLTHLAIELKAIVVAPNYRLGALGNLALPSLSAASRTGVSGNFGITDLHAALLWVRDNIAAWGGDPRRVTLLGQSSGGTNILALIANTSAHAQDPGALFRAAISLSGSPNMTASLRDAEAFNQAEVLQSSSCANASDIRACLMGLSAVEANRLFPPSFSSDFAYANGGLCPAQGCPFAPFPFVDGTTVREPLPTAFRSISPDVETVVLQSLAQEMAMISDPEVANITSSEQYVAFLQDKSASLGYANSFAPAMEELYGSSVPVGTPYYTMLSDMGVSTGQTALARALYDVSAIPQPPTVLVGYVVCRPAEPFLIGPDTIATDLSFHNWDFTAATGAWSAYTDAPFFAAAPYVPAASDMAFQVQLLGQWRAVVHGAQPPWAEFGTQGLVGVVDCRETTTQDRRQFEQNITSALSPHPPEVYWWVG